MKCKIERSYPFPLKIKFQFHTLFPPPTFFPIFDQSFKKDRLFFGRELRISTMLFKEDQKPTTKWKDFNRQSQKTKKCKRLNLFTRSWTYIHSSIFERGRPCYFMQWLLVKAPTVNIVGEIKKPLTFIQTVLHDKWKRVFWSIFCEIKETLTYWGLRYLMIKGTKKLVVDID